LDERTDSGREFQTAGSAAWKEQVQKIRLVRRTCKGFKKKNDEESVRGNKRKMT